MNKSSKRKKEHNKLQTPHHTQITQNRQTKTGRKLHTHQKQPSKHITQNSTHKITTNKQQTTYNKAAASQTANTKHKPNKSHNRHTQQKQAS